MTLPVLAHWVRAHPYPLAVLVVLGCVLASVLRAVRRSIRRPPAAVVTAALAALLCTAYSGDTSWRFARDHLGMASGAERGIMFAAAEVSLFSMALMARQNLRTLHVPGTPGVLVWVVTGVQVIPAYSETGPVAGTVRAFFGPVCAALLWHLAMGIELRHHTPGGESQSLPAVLVRELRERALSWLGLSRRGRDAAQITRDRWTGIATRRAARLADLQDASAAPWRLSRARRRLAVAVDRTDAGVLGEQRAVLLDRIAAYRGAADLASMALPAPWATQAKPADVEVQVERVPEPEAQPEYAYPTLPGPVPEPYPQILAGVPGPNSELSPAAPAVLAAEGPRTRTGVHAEYVPDEPEDDSPPPPGEDNLTATARADFLDVLVGGDVPSIRDLKGRYGIGQARATRIQTELKKGLT